MTNVHISDLYEKRGNRLMLPTGKEIAVAGADAAEKAEKLNGNPDDFSADKEAGQDLNDREAGDLGELVAVRWLKDVAPEAFDFAPCEERGESATADVVAGGLTIDVKARNLDRGLPATDLLVGAGEVDRKADDIDVYLSVVVSADRSEVIIQGWESTEAVRDKPIVNLGHGPVRLTEAENLKNPNSLLKEVSQ